MRISAPIRFGRATSQNFWSTEYGKRVAGSATTTTLHRVHTENPMCSEKIEKIRLRRATRRPVDAQKPSSSGSQCVMVRPLGCVAGGVTASEEVGAIVAVMAGTL